ncbi:MAG: hypothetical protein LBR11_00180 [Deltaproteobacteria bacterium]|jgi:hypothetical protein|nr:hypothetical protein [Deltaproteobacteria bacterium]
MSDIFNSSQYHYVSLVGESIIATILTFLGYKQTFKSDPLSVNLLATSKVEALLPALKSKILEYSPSIEINHIPISYNKLNDIESFKEVKNIFANLEDKYKYLAINMMGGMKKLNFSGIFALNVTDHIFLQLNDEDFWISKFVNGSLRVEKNMPVPIETKLTVKELLDLQQIKYEVAIEKPNWDLKNLCHKAKVKCPEGALYNVVIDGLRIDCVWNAGNNILNFLFIIVSKQSNYLDNSRIILLLAATKDWLNNLYNRKIYVLESNKFNIERYDYESGGKISSYNIYWDNYSMKLETSEYLNRIFAQFKVNKENKQSINRTIWTLAPKRTLITSVGKMSEATFIAIKTHKCPQVILIYTGNDSWIINMVEIIKKKASELGLEDVHFLETSFTAANCFSQLPKEQYNLFEVNVTPGTKPQGAVLGLWAKANNIPTWIIDGKKICRIDSEMEEKPVVGLNLKNRLDLMLDSAKVSDYGWSKESFDWNIPFYSNMFIFMNKLLQNNKENYYLNFDIQIDGFEQKISDYSWELIWPDPVAPSRIGRFIGEKESGFWYEKLTAKAVDAMNQLPAKTRNYISFDVSNGVEVSNDNQSITLSERDVLVATSDAQLFMISCKKSQKIDDEREKRLLIEVVATAKTLGRFVVPMLCTRTLEEPTIKNGVCVFGWTTLCQPEELFKTFVWASNKLLGQG